MKEYEGMCKYCGSVQLVLANTQEEANEIICAKCECNGAELEEIKNNMLANINDVCSGEYGFRAMNDQEKDLAIESGLKVLHGHAKQVAITYSHSKLTITKSSEKIKVKRSVVLSAVRE